MLFQKCSGGGGGGGGKWRFGFVEGRGHALFLVVIGGLRGRILERKAKALPST